MIPCGHWKGLNQVTKKFEDLKLSFHGERPRHEVFAQDFTTSVENIRKLISQQITLADSDPNAIQRGFIIPSRANGSSLLKFRHAVFEVSSAHSLPVFESDANLPNSQKKTDGNASDTASEADGT